MNTPDMHNLFLLHDVDMALFTEAKCIDLLDRWHFRMTALKREYPKGSLLPTHARGELKHILSSMHDLESEMRNRDCRLN